MGFLDSLSRWFSGVFEEDSAKEAATTSTETPGPSQNDGHASIEMGARLLMNVAGQHFMVQVTHLTDKEVRVTFPGIDYPVEGMLVALEVHDDKGFSRYQTRVIEGPRKEGDGVLLERTSIEYWQQHRDSYRIETNLEAKLQLDGQDGEDPGTVTNISTGGVLVDCERKFELNSLLKLRFVLPNGAAAALTVKVLHVGKPREVNSRTLYTYGTNYESYEPGTGHVVTNYIRDRLKELYPTV